MDLPSMLNRMDEVRYEEHVKDQTGTQKIVFLLYNAAAYYKILQ
jgi:hypothetical protein